MSRKPTNRASKPGSRQLIDVKDQSMEAKRLLNPEADELNFIDDRGKLVCGAKKKRNPNARCRSPAGSGTTHKGYGRCKFCGGLNTGPKTEEGKQKVSQNARKHGFYAKTMRPKEKEVYEELREAKALDVSEEIYMVKAKILVYLEEWRDKYDQAYAEAVEKAKKPKPEKPPEGYVPDPSPEEYARRATRVYFTTGLEQERAYYHAGTADDRVLTRQLDLLRRLVDSQAKLNPNQGQGLLDTINAELRAASHTSVSMGWGARPAQARTSERDGHGNETPPSTEV